MTMTTEKQNRLLSVCASVGLHTLAAAVLIFGLSGHARVPETPGRLAVVWASIASGKDASSPPAPQAGPKKPSGAEGRSSAAGKAQAAENFPPALRTSVSADAKAASDEATLSFETQTAVYAEAPGHGTFPMPEERRRPPLYSQSLPAPIPDIGRTRRPVIRKRRGKGAMRALCWSRWRS